MEDKLTVEKFLADGHLFVDGDQYDGDNGRVTIGYWITAETANDPSKYDKDLTVVSAKCLEKTEGNKHLHHDMICAKAANMDLAIFINGNSDWLKLSDSPMPRFIENEYFLCLPQHAEACLHWLNGGELILGDGMIWLFAANVQWSLSSPFMRENSIIKIKPRTEKRWAIYLNHNGIMMASNFKDKASTESIFAINGWSRNYAQIIEIEIEV